MIDITAVNARNDKITIYINRLAPMEFGALASITMTRDELEKLADRLNEWLDNPVTLS